MMTTGPAADMVIGMIAMMRGTGAMTGTDMMTVMTAMMTTVAATSRMLCWATLRRQQSVCWLQ